MSISLYFHIPFCTNRCTYCNFYLTTDKTLQLEENFVHALIKEIELHTAFHGQEVETIFFGGGSPNCLSDHYYPILFDSLHKNFQFRSDCEISIELNPTDTNVKSLSLYKEIGINRISMGIQTFNENLMKILQRKNSFEKIYELFNVFNKLCFKNLNVDLIFDIPTQTVEDIERDIVLATNLNIKHISYYGLTLDKQNPIFKMYPDWEKSDFKAYYFNVLKLLGNAGFSQYEISNYAREGFECKHNLNYWLDKQYIGFGPSASSFFFDNEWGRRTTNINNVKQYIEGVMENKPRFLIEEVLTRKQRLMEYVYTNLRMKSGLKKKIFEEKFCVELNTLFTEKMNDFVDKGFIVDTNESLYLTDDGAVFSDSICLECLNYE